MLWILFIILGIVALPILLVAFMVFWMAILWLFGFPIKISVEGKEIGYIRWFKIRHYQ